MYGITEARVGFDSPNPLPPRLRCPSSPWPSSSLEPLDARPPPPRCPALPSSNPHGHARGSRCRSATRRPGGLEGQLEGGESTPGDPRYGSTLSPARSAPYPRWVDFPPGPPARGELPADRLLVNAGAQPRRRPRVPTPSPAPSWGLRRVPQGCCRPEGRARSARQDHPRNPAGSPRHPSRLFPLEGLAQELRQQLRHHPDARAWDDLPTLTPKLG